MPLPPPRARWLPAALALLPLLLLYLATLQTIPNGSSHYFMLDAGETQIVLNEWGSLHMTGYPLYVLSGNALTAILRAAGLSPLVAPALVSLLWGLLSLLLFHALGAHLGLSPWLMAAATLLYGLTRSFWVHNVIAEIYSFNQLLLLILLCLALWRRPVPGRVCWLALAGGIALAHHRAFLTIIPALLYAVWPILRAAGRALPRLLLLSLLLGTLGFASYAWPLLRARAGAAWVYGAPSTLPNLLNLMTGAEAGRFIGPPASLAALQSNLSLVNDALLTDLSLPGILLGLAGLILAIRAHRRTAITLLLLAAGPWLFHILLYSDILSALILPVTLSFAFGQVFAADILLRRFPRRRIARLILALAIAAAALTLLQRNFAFIRHLTTDPTGLQTVAALEAAPPGATVMLAWGPRYFAASAAQLYLGRLPRITLASDQQNLRPAFLAGALLTPDYTFHNQPPAWWAAKLGRPVWLDAAAPRLVRIRPAPDILPAPASGPQARSPRLHCEPDRLVLELVWHAGQSPPPTDLSVFVKAFSADGALLAQGDQFAPVYGLRPTSAWRPGERLRDFYPLDLAPAQVSALSYGLYHVDPDGAFVNQLEYRLEVNCRPP